MAIMSLMLQQHGIDSIRYDEHTTSPQQLPHLHKCGHPGVAILLSCSALVILSDLMGLLTGACKCCTGAYNCRWCMTLLKVCSLVQCWVNMRCGG